MNLDDYEGHTEGPWDADAPLGIHLKVGQTISAADARLIAAAPELLEDNKRMRNLLMLIVKAVGVDQDDYHEVEWDWQDFESFMPQVEKWYKDEYLDHKETRHRKFERY